MPYGAEQPFDMLEQRAVRMNVQYSHCIFWVALWSGMSPHAVDVQTDASCPQCICKNALKPNSSWKTKPHCRHSMPLLHVLAHSCFEKEFRTGVSLCSVAIPGSSSHSEMDRVRPITPLVFIPFHGHNKIPADVSSCSPEHIPNKIKESTEHTTGKPQKVEQIFDQTVFFFLCKD